MPKIPFEALPDSGRVWVFASDRPLTGADAERLLGAVDEFLDQWKAHGAPLRCGRDWREDRFLTIGVDPTHEQASGCSIDGLFRALQGMQREIGAQLLGGGRVFYRDVSGSVRLADRGALDELTERGELKPETPVFDTTLTTVREYRTRFERPAAESWTAGVFAGR